MKVPQLFSVLAAFTVLFAHHAGAQGTLVRPQPAQPGTPASRQPTPDQIAKMPVTALHVEDFKLLSSGTGWASTGSRLLRTIDNGAHWKDISPPNPKHDGYASVFFHDADTGWVLFAHEIQEGENPTPKSPENQEVLYVSATTDGGTTWTKEDLPTWEGQHGLGGSGIITFADKLHGWLSMDVGGNTMTAGSALLLTSDGGRTWHDTPDAEEGPEGRIQAILTPTDKDVWILGTPEGGPAMLWATHDGGNSYQGIALPAPNGIAPAEYPTYSLPTFTDGLHGYEAVSYSGGYGEKSTAMLYATADGGRTWKPDRTLSNLPEQETVDSTVVGSTWILAFAPQGSQPTLVKVNPNDRITAVAQASSGDFRHCGLTFLAPNEGWMNCSGNLSATIDGGAAWASIAPRVRNGLLSSDPITPVPAPKTLKTRPIKLVGPKTVPFAADASPGGGGLTTGVDQHLGFDKSYVLSRDQMATWWASSPYYDVGIYLPGSPNRGNDVTLTGHKGKDGLAWVAAASSQGWGFMPIWFGPQAPCACHNPATGPHAKDTYPNCRLFGHKKGNEWISGAYSFEPNAAYEEGVVQADKAMGSAEALGLGGKIVYVDAEQFTSTNACAAAVQGYLSGFVNELHESGAIAGVYGGLYDVVDFSAADDYWVARADNRVTVWNLSQGLDASASLPDACPSGTCWNNKQRIHQYRIDKIENWGGTRITDPVDNDIVDATIVPSSGTKEYPAIGEIPFSTGSNGEVLLAIANGKDNASGLKLGEAVGMYILSDTPLCLPYLPSNPVGVFTYLGGATTAMFSYGGAPETAPTGINNLGQIVGSYSPPFDEYCNSTTNGFYTTASNPTSPISLDYGAMWTELTGINDAGWIVGNYIDVDSSGNETGHCVLWKPPYNAPQPFDMPGAQPFSLNGCTGINGLGQIIGQAMNSEGSNSFFVDDAEAGDPNDQANFSTISAPDGELVGGVWGINNNGQIVGFYYGESSDSPAGPFILNNAQFIIWPPDASSGPIYGINDDLQMVAGNAFLYGLPIQP